MAFIIALNLGLLAFLAFFVWVLHRRHRSYFQLGILFAVSLAISYPFRVLQLLFFPDLCRPGYPGLTALSTLATLSFVQILPIVACCVGYWIWDTKAKRHPVLDMDLVPKDDPWDFWLLGFLYAISLGAKGIKIVTGNYVSFLIGDNQDLRWANIVENLHMVGWACLAGVWVLYFQRRVKSPAQWFFFVAVSVVEFSYQIIQGSKTFLLLPFLIFLLSFYHVKKRVPLGALAGVALFAALVVFPFVSSYRTYFGSKYSGGIPSLGEFNAGQALKDTYQESQGADRNLGESLLTMFSRFAGADELYNIEAIVPSVMPYTWGRDFTAVLYTAVPRVLWPNKPIISAGKDYGEALGTNTAITPFPLGEMYWNFGNLGMSAGMFLWGVLLAACMSLFDRFFRWPDARFLAVAILISETYWLTTGEGMLAMQVATVVKKIIIYVVLYQGAKVCWGVFFGRRLDEDTMRRSRFLHLKARGTSR